jgi:glycosyltransferase involved in cell wall biosynthesis
VRILVVTNMYPTKETPAVGTFVYDQVASLRRAGTEIDVLFVNGRASTWNYLWGFFRLWRALLRHRGRWDLIHAHYVLTGIIARAQWGLPVVLTHHGPEVLGHPRWQTQLCKIVTPLFDEVIYVTEQMRRALRDSDGWVIPCGIDMERFVPIDQQQARAATGLPEDRPLVLWAGEFWRPEKRFDLVTAAVEHVRRALPAAELVLLTKRPHDVVPGYMNACDALVLTSRLEGSPMVIKEAMACNLPIVSVDVGDVPEVVDGTVGCAIVERDPADIAARLIDVLRRPRRSDGRERVRRFSFDRTASEIFRVYEHALAKRRAARAQADMTEQGTA